MSGTDPGNSIIFTTNDTNSHRDWGLTIVWNKRNSDSMFVEIDLLKDQL